MARFIYKEVKCGCCGKIVKVKRIMSNTSYEMTLDGNKDNLYQYLLEVCPKCRYPSLDITKSSQVNPIFVDKLYLIERNHIKKTIPFMVAGIIYKGNHEFLNASFMYRAASWICSNENDVQLSTVLKKQACEYIIQYLKSLDGMTAQDIGISIVLIDTYRQIGEFSEAKELCDDLMNIMSQFDENEEIKYYRKLVNYESHIIDKKDTHIHYVSEVN